MVSLWNQDGGQDLPKTLGHFGCSRSKEMRSSDMILLYQVVGMHKPLIPLQVLSQTHYGYVCFFIAVRRCVVLATNCNLIGRILNYIAGCKQ